MPSCVVTAHVGDELQIYTALIQLSGAYSAGDAIGDKFELDSVTIDNGGYAEIVQVNLIEMAYSAALQKKQVGLLVSSQDYTAAVDSAAFKFAPTVGTDGKYPCFEMLNLAPASSNYVEIVPYSSGVVGIATAKSNPSAKVKSDTSRKFYAQLKALEAITYVNHDFLQVNIYIKKH